MKQLYRTSFRVTLRTLFVASLIFFSTHGFAQLTVNTSVSASQLVSALLGGGLNVSNISLNCPTGAYGTFANGNTTNLGVNNGILLTTGAATNAIGPNNTASSSYCNGTSFTDPQLTALEPLANEDVCILQFDLVPNCNNLQIRFVFGSEEYPEFVNSGFNDAFGFFISGPGPACQAGYYNNTNVATLPNNTTIVSIDNVNASTNSAYYVNNAGGPTIQYDAFTTVLTRNVSLCPCQTYHFKLAIADAGDCSYDSGVFVDFLQCSTALTATSSFTPTTGCSACNGTATATASGGNPPYNYSWSPSGGNAATATGLCPGTYTCTITDQGGCTQPQTVTVTIPPSGGVTSALSTQSNVNCNGGNNGSATVTASGGTGIYTYSWAPSGGTSATATGLAAGTYTCTITDSGGCTSQQVVTITQPSALSASATSTNSNCATNGGSATVTPSGGTPGYTYSWSPSGGNAATASNLGGGSYTCTITDALGCSTTQSVSIAQTNPVSSSSTTTSVNCFGNSTGSATVTATGGSGNFTYSWSPSGGTGATASNLPAGNYTCTITDSNNCTSQQVVNITQPSAVNASASSTASSCTSNTGSATVTASGGSGTYTYSWAPSGGTAATESNLGPGSYTCTVTDGNGCQQTAVATVTSLNGPSSTVQAQTDVLCNGGSTGSATINATGGAGNYTYNWTPSGGTAATASNLSAGTYTCTVTDGSGCTVISSVTITQPAAISAPVTVTPLGCNATTSATANVSGGNGPYTYSWSSGGNGQTESNLGAGSYTLTVTDANSCSVTTPFTVVPSAAITVTATSADATCFGGNNGTATVSPSGGNPPYTYSWSPTGGTNATATGLTPGTYTCTITDANGCTTTQTVAVSQPTQLTATASGLNVSCFGATNGSASVNASGGTGTYTYSWSPSGGTAATASGLAAGTYVCTITDANGCTTTQSAVLTQPTALTASATGNSVCSGGSATISASPSGGTGPYTYVWSNGATSASQAVNPAVTTTYTVTVIDANSCSTTATTTLTVNPSPTASITTNAVNGYFNLTGATGDLCFTGTTGVASWNWVLNGTTTSTQQSPCVTVTAANTGSYCAALVVTSAAGCVDTAETCVEITNSSYSIPNVFTPNGDGNNDQFIITNTGMKELHCMIYDRWGVLIYEWDGTTGNWDGKAKNGGEAVDGVYYYTAHLVDYSNQVFDESGFVHLIRGN